MPTESNLDQELRLILSKAIAKYTPTRILREMNKEWWLDLTATEDAIKQAIDEHVIGEDIPIIEPENKENVSREEMIHIAVTKGMNAQRGTSRKALYNTEEKL